MKYTNSILAASLLSFCLLAPSARAQAADSSLSADQKDAAAQKVTITTVSSPATAGTTSGGGSYVVGKPVTLKAKANAGAVFVNWTTNGVPATNNANYTFTAGAVSLTAQANFDWVVATSSSPAGAGTTTGAGSYANGATVTITATPTNGCYDFVNWTKAGKVFSPSASQAFTITNGDTLVANFTLKEDVITTASYPANAGTITGKGTYACGKTVTVKATPANGYKFICWKVADTTVSTANPFSFPAEGTETLTADFSDISVPTLTITSPKNGAKEGASQLTVSGTANNVLGVSCVFLTVNGEPASVNSSNNFATWSASVALSPGANVISAYAESEVGNPSKTNTVTVTDTITGWAPASLAGLIAQVQQGTNSPFEASFGAATLEQFSSDTNQGSSVANYTYTQTGSNTAVLVNTSFAPPDQAGSGGGQVSFTFTGPNSLNFTSSDGHTGTATFAQGSDLDVSSQSGWTYNFIDSTGNTGTTIFGDGTFTRTDSHGDRVSGGYTSTQYGPMAAMIVMTNPELDSDGVDTNYSLVIFTTHGSGSYYLVSYDAQGDPPSYNHGTFTGTYHSTGVQYVAPETLNGVIASVSQTGKSSFTVNFGEATMSQTTTSTNDNKSRVSNYTYTRTNANKGVLIINNYLPPSMDNGGGGPIVLTFQSSTSATFSQSSSDGTDTGTVTLKPPVTLAPAALTQGTLGVNFGAGNTGTATFSEGNFTISSDNKYGTYTYAPFSPTVGMIVLTFTDPDHAGEVGYLQLTFSSSGPNTICNTKNDGTVELGTFTLTQ